MNNKDFAFTSISALLLNFLPEDQKWKLKVFEHWEEIVGNLKNVVSIEKIENDFILLNVPHSSWAQELNFLQDIIKSKINTVIGEEKIRALRFRVGTIKNKKQNLAKSKKPEHEANLKSNPRNINKINFIKDCAKKINDSDLKKALEDYLIRCLDQQ